MIRSAVFAAVLTLAFSTAAGARCPDRKPVRPKAFEPFSTLLLGAKGFAMYGCFPGGAALSFERDAKGNNGVGNGEDGQPPGNPPVNDGPGTGPGRPGNKGGKKEKVLGPTTNTTVAVQLGPKLEVAAGEAFDVFGLSVVHVEQPPLSPEELREMAELKGEKDAGKVARLGVLEAKLKRYETARREVRAVVNVGATRFVASKMLLRVNDAAIGEAAHVMDLRPGDASVREFRPWLHATLRPLGFKCDLEEMFLGPEQVGLKGTLELYVVAHQGANCLFGNVVVNGKSSFVAAHECHSNSRAARPPWHHWLQAGYEEGGGWRPDPESGPVDRADGAP